MISYVWIGSPPCVSVGEGDTEDLSCKIQGAEDQRREPALLRVGSL